MFTGIIEELGTVLKVEKGSNSSKLTINAQTVLQDVHLGDSIAINGVCLTVVHFDGNQFSADVMAETLAKSNLNELISGTRVNLERAMRLGDRMGGHMVQGHIDGSGSIVGIEKKDIAFLYWIKTEDQVLRYIVPKGSITVDGISLTVAEVQPDRFCVSLIPHTAVMTTLGLKKIEETVNLETDIIGRYVEKLLGQQPEEADKDIKLDFLAENGFA
ncbi:MAG: riboflavin synthase [Bacillota bacterium]|nr:riboflavin synthase [Bacillota bacterium]